MKQKLEYHFHNLNPDGVLEKYIEAIIIENGVERLFQIMQETKENETKKVEKVR